MTYKNIPVSEAVYAEVRKLADDHHWTLGFTIEYLLDLAAYRLVDVTTLPHPADGQPVPLVEVKESK
jgi:hypothetical protein